MTREIGIELQLESRYGWIVFLPNISTGVGALNRYYGRFEIGELKLRGIALRRKDTQALVGACRGICSAGCPKRGTPRPSC